MKLKMALLVACLALPQVAQAGLLSASRSADWETKATHKYKIDVMNFDVRVYEWTPQDNLNVRCVFAAGNQNSSGVSCYDVSPQKAVK